MNIKDYTLKIGYRVSGKRKEESVEYSLVKNGYEGEDIVLRDYGDENHVKIVLSVKGDVQIDLAELIYDHSQTVFNPGRPRESIKGATCNTDCVRSPNCRS